jgi:hypothetical protein
MTTPLWNGSENLVGFDKTFSKMLEANEASLDKALTLTKPASLYSGWSTGILQHDFGQTPNRALLEELLTATYDSGPNQGQRIISESKAAELLASDKLLGINNPNALTSQEIALVNSAIQSKDGQATLYAAHASEISSRGTEWINTVLSQVTNQQVKDYLQSSLVARLILADSRVQQGDAVNNTHIQFLNGELVKYPDGGGSVQIEGKFDLSDLIRARAATDYVLNQGRLWDIARRVRNAIDQDPSYIPSSEEEATGLIRFAERLRAESTKTREYIVQPGDTTSSIARKLGTNPGLLEDLNDGLWENDRAKPLPVGWHGQKLNIPHIRDNQRWHLTNTERYLRGKVRAFTATKNIADTMSFLSAGLVSVLPPPRRDPLIIDLDGDGIETTPPNGGVHFDFNGDGIAENTGWASARDGLLAVDWNGNGVIDDGSELFSEWSLLPNGGRASSGFQALSAHDANGDGRIDAQDGIWNDLRIWLDSDQDGITYEGEIFTLAEIGISAIDISTSPVGIADSSGNLKAATGSVQWEDGTTSEIAEYRLQSNLQSSLYDLLPESDAVLALPEVEGHGYVYSLRQAMARDTTGALQSLVESFVAATDQTARAQLLDQILYAWTGASGVNPASRTTLIDSRKLVVLERFTARTIGGILGGDQVLALGNVYQRLVETVYGQLVAQTSLKDLYDSISYSYDASIQDTRADLSNAIAQLQSEFASDPGAATIRLGEFARSLRGLGLQDTVNYLSFRESFLELDPALGPVIDAGGLPLITRRGQGDFPTSNHVLGTNRSEAVLWDYTQGGDGVVNAYSGNDVLYGSPFHDTLIQELGNAFLVGLGGNDVLYAGAGDDILDGGTGNDALLGEAGNDTYLFRRGDGRDWIIDSDPTPGNIDTLWFGSRLTLADLGIRRIGNDLVVSILGGEDSVTVVNHFQLNTNANRVERFVFQDGTVISDSDFLALSLFSTEGDDVIFGGGGGNRTV